MGKTVTFNDVIWMVKYQQQSYHLYLPRYLLEHDCDRKCNAFCLSTGARHLMIAYTKSMIVYESMHSFGAITLAPSLVSPHTDNCTRPRMAPKLWRESYSAKGMHALIDYHRSDILPSNVERLWFYLISTTDFRRTIH